MQTEGGGEREDSERRKKREGEGETGAGGEMGKGRREEILHAFINM